MISALFLLLVALFAWLEAKRDARLIREGAYIDHFLRWIFRAFVVGAGAIPVVGLHALALKWALLCIAAGALFSACFRLFLNKRRGKHWAYVAPWSNVHDKVWYALSGGPWLHPDLYELEISWYDRNVVGTRENVHRAGRLAYICEGLVTLAALIGVAINN